MIFPARNFSPYTRFAALISCLVFHGYSANASPSVPPAPVDLRKVEPIEILNVVNNHPFDIREMLTFPVDAPSEANIAFAREIGGENAKIHPLQLHRKDGRVYAWLDVSLDAGANVAYEITSAQPNQKPSIQKVEETGFYTSGLPKGFKIGGGALLPAFDMVVVEDADALDEFHVNREARVRRALETSLREGKLSFRKTGSSAGPMLAEFHYEAEGGRFNDYTFIVVHRVHNATGVIDTDMTIKTRNLRTPKIYLAVAKFIPTMSASGAVVRWKGDIMGIPSGGASRERTVRSDNWTRDINWLALGQNLPGKLTQPLLSRNIPGLVRVHKGTLRNVNDFLVNEYALGTDRGWMLLAEIAREHRELKNYIPLQFVPPDAGEALLMEYRMLPPGEYNARTIDNAFTSFAGYQGASIDKPGAVRVSMGVSGVQFGTSYFPNSTFGENFEFWRSAGMQGGRRLGKIDVNLWWPIFEHPLLFKEEIRRDMRIVNSLGLDWVRIHHFDSPDFRKDYIQTAEGKWMHDYIEFMVQTARECGLGIFLDFSLSPNDIAYIARRFGDVIKYYEIQNEALIVPGAKVDRLDYWVEVRDRIQKERPGAPVLVTGGSQFFALFDGLERHGVTFNATGQHSYVDRREVPAHFRDIAVSLGGYASRRGTHALNSEYNWRMITRESEQAQAEHFAEIAGYLFEPRGMSLALQFQLQETFCVPPRNRGALRHYEPLRVDRTPKPQTYAYKDIIRKYGTADNRLRHVSVEISETTLFEPGAEFSYNVTIQNVGNRPLLFQIKQDLPEGFSTAESALTLGLNPGERHSYVRKAISPENLQPGVYHIFEEIRYDEDVYYGWGMARHVARPRLDLAQPLLKDVDYKGGKQMLDVLDLSMFESAVFGENAPALEVDWALYLYQSLRCATGAPVTRETDATLSLEEAVKKNLVVVGTPASNSLLKAIEKELPVFSEKLHSGNGLIVRVDAPRGNAGTIWLVVTGADAEGVERAASDLLYRYWRHAKAASSFRDGMPQIEGSWAGTEPERKLQPASDDSVRNATPRMAFESVVLHAPLEGRAGVDFRVVATESAEPPGPAAGLTINIRLNGKIIQNAVTSPTGEAVFRIDFAGTYEICVDKEGVPAKRITIIR